MCVIEMCEEFQDDSIIMITFYNPSQTNIFFYQGVECTQDCKSPLLALNINHTLMLYVVNVY